MPGFVPVSFIPLELTPTLMSQFMLHLDLILMPQLMLLLIIILMLHLILMLPLILPFSGLFTTKADYAFTRLALFKFRLQNSRSSSPFLKLFH